jgi:hypothetical protein
MKLFKFFWVFLVGLSLFSCGSISNGTQMRSNENKQEFLVFLYETNTDDYQEIESIVIMKGVTSGLASYTVDRYSGTTQTLVTLQMGSFNIDGNKIVIKTDKSNFEGMIYEEKIIINNKEYILTEK